MRVESEGTIMKILLLAALKSEFSRLLAKYKPERVLKEKNSELFFGEYGRLGCYFGITGVGAKNVRRFFSLLDQKIIPLNGMISSGYAGGLRAGLRPGSIVSTSFVIDSAAGIGYKASELVRTGDLGLKCETGTALTVNGVFGRKEKEALLEKHPGALFIDMESSAVLQEAKNRNIPCQIIRAVSDSLESELPPMEFVQDSWDRIDTVRFIGHMLSHPADIVRFARLFSGIYQAGKSIERIFDAVIAGLNPPADMTMKRN